MQVHLNEIDSLAFGGAVLGISEFDAQADFAAFEGEYRAQHSPRYVSAKVPVGDLTAIHALEAAGFRLVEIQLTGDIPVQQRNTEGQPYRFEKVTSEAVLAEVLEIAGTSFDLDRYSKDPGIGAVLGGRRYQEYVKKSFLAADEEVCRMVDPADGRTLTFKTHKFAAPDHAIGLLSAVRVDHKGSGIGLIADSFYFNYLGSLGVKRVTTSFSAEHRVIVQHLIGNMRLKVRSTHAILRKLY
ncbi:MAG: hypothetical protein IPK32_03845 [Verrucomicrobiaceae bacterium]|nr:hypothetical protein [Verrucomicrobiaceae bacterium]